MQLLHGDCLELMKDIPDGSVDLVLTDPPYGTMKGINDQFYWDTVLPTKEMFLQCSRVLRQNGKCVLFSQEPYTSNLITNAIPQMPFSYRAIWKKDASGNSLMAKKAMISMFEDVCIFSNKETHGLLHKSTWKITELIELVGFEKFSKIMLAEGRYKNISSAKRATYKKMHIDGWNDYDSNPFDEKMYRYLETKIDMPYTFDEYFSIVDKYKEKTKPVFNLWQGKKSKSNVLEYAKDRDGYHPTQKPVALLEDLIKTYSNEGDTVMDFTMGSGSTGVACMNTGRDFIGIELDQKYFQIAEARIYGTNGKTQEYGFHGNDDLQMDLFSRN